MAEEQKRARRNPFGETPVQEISGILDRCPRISLKVLKRSPAMGKLITVYPSLDLDTMDLLNGKLEELLQAKAGGGEYTVYGRDPATMVEDVIPPYYINLPGPPHDPRHVPQARLEQAYAGTGAYAQPVMAQPGGYGFVPPAAYHTPGIPVPQPFGPAGGMTLPPQEALPVWARGYPVDQQWSVYYKSLEQSGRLPAGASLHSDQLATQHASAWQTQYSGERAENAKLREKLEAMEKERREAEARWQKEISEAKVAAEKSKLDGEIAALRSELAMIRDGGHRRQGPDWAAVLAALSPLAIPLVSYFSERSKSAALMSIEMRKLEAKQHENMLMLTKPQEQKSNLTELVAVLAPLVGPLLLKMMDNSSPSMQAELLEMRNNSTLMQIKMLADIADRYDGEDPKPAWYPALEAVLGTIQKMGAQYQYNKMQQPQPRPPLPSNGAGANGNGSVAAASSAVEPHEAQIWATMEEIDAEAAQITHLVWDSMPRDAGFHTNEWRVILFNVHAKTEYEELVPEIVKYLNHLAGWQQLPPILTDVFANPEKFALVINGLPISKMDPAYAAGLTEALVATIKAQRETGTTAPTPSAIVEAVAGPGDEDDADEYEDESDDDSDESDDDSETAHA